VPAFAVAMGVAVFVSLPFTTYTLLAGLQTIPDDVLEAARIDGAGRVASYRLIVLPMLRPAIAVATLINIINVFNSLPILRMIAGSIPGYSADTTTTLIFKLIQTERQVDTASALSVVNFALVVVITLVYLRIARPMRED
jgi:multiple sugar transport system permease protein